VVCCASGSEKSGKNAIIDDHTTYYSERRDFPTCHRNFPGLSSLKLTLFNLLMRNDIAAAGVAVGPWDRTTKEVQRFWTVESYLEKASGWLKVS
jgi:hypothetical protein